MNACRLSALIGLYVLECTECTRSPLRNPRAVSLIPGVLPHLTREESGKASAEAYRSVSSPFTQQVDTIKEFTYNMPYCVCLLTSTGL